MRASVIITTYNYAAYIVRAIDSVLTQEGLKTRPEIIVVDDGSTDDTAAHVAPYVANSQVLYIWQPNSGKAAATRLGIEKANGDVLFTLDADDYFLPGKIAATLAVFETYPDVVHVASPALYCYSNGTSPDCEENIPKHLIGRELKGEATLQYFMYHKVLYGGGSTFAARTIFLKQMPFPDAVDMYTDEWLVIQALVNGNSYFLPDCLSVWQIHGKNYSGRPNHAGDLKAKQERLAASSQAIVSELINGFYPHWLKRVYTLKHEVRLLAWKEENGSKLATDRLRFLGNCIWNLYPLKWWWVYRIPLRVLK